MLFRTSAAASFLLLSAASVACASLAGCAAPSDGDEDVAASEAELNAREGYHPIEGTEGSVFVSVAVSGKRAFVGDNNRTLRVVDLETMRTTKTVSERIPVESLSVSGNILAACGDRDEEQNLLRPTDRHYVITLLDARTLAKKKEIKLGIQQYLNGATTNGFIDLPSMSCNLDMEAGTVSVSFSQAQLPDEIVTFAIPAETARYDFRDIPGATRVKVTDSRDNTIKSFASGEHGLTYAAGGYGIRRVAPGARDVAQLRDEGREHYVGIAERGGKLFAADHGAGLRVLDSATGSSIAAVEVDDWIEGVALAQGHVVVVGRAGLFVTKDRWSR